MTSPQEPPAQNVTEAPLPEIPVIDVTHDVPTLGVAEAVEDRLEALFAQAEAHYGRHFLALSDRLSRRWGMRNSTPYQREIVSFASRLPVPGGWFLNVGFDPGGTTGIQADPDTGAMQMIRVLDWPLAGLGQGLIAARQRGPAGPYLNITWPGFTGVVTAIARGRFAAALNQAPLRRRGLGSWGDWTASRIGIWRTCEMPPMHLLRQVFDYCTSYADARHALMHGPVSASAIFTLVGASAGEGCVIERTPRQAWVRPAPTAAANHWQTGDLPSRTRSRSSHARLDYMTTLLKYPVDNSFGWLMPPLLTTTTRLAATLNPMSGHIAVRGYEGALPVTRSLILAI